MIKTCRVYDPPGDGGFRILVDRLWPRGLSKEEAKLDMWLKDIGPGDDLRKWFGHDPDKWEEFKDKFFWELDQKKELVDQIIEKAKNRDVILLFGAKDGRYNNAVALKEYIENRMLLEDN